MDKLILKENLIFESGMKLNFQSFQMQIIHDKELTFFQLGNSSISDSQFRNVNLFNASFLGTKFSNISFDKCNMKNMDICSIWASNCNFSDVDFSNSNLTDCTFIHCVFKKAVFLGINLSSCQFLDCSFEQFPIEDSSCSLNSFVRCKISNTKFTESFYYQIFEDCTFNHAELNPELLGYNFGFSDDDFNALTANVDLDIVESKFIQNALFVNAAILRINQARDYCDLAMIACVAAVGKMIENDILIKADEIQFLIKLTEHLFEKGQIAPITILKTWQMLNILLDTNFQNKTAINKSMPYLREYANMLYFYFITFQEELQSKLVIPSDQDSIYRTCELQIVYEEQPTLPFFNVLHDITVLSNPLCPEPRFLRTEKGSYIELFEFANAAIPYVQTFFTLLSSIVPVVIYKLQKQNEIKRNAAHLKGKSKASETNIASACTQQVMLVSPLLLPSVELISSDTNNVFSTTIRIINNGQFTLNSDFSGYNGKNIKSITITIE